MAFTDMINQIIVALFLLLIFVNILGALQPDLASELNNTDAHPNGPLTLTIIGFFGLAIAVKILITIFEKGKERLGGLGLGGE